MQISQEQIELFNTKYKAFFIIFKWLSLKLIKTNFLEDESSILRSIETDGKIIKCALFLYLEMKEPFHSAASHLVYIICRHNIFNCFEKLVSSPFILFLDSTKLKIVWKKVTSFKRRVSIIL